MPEYEIAILHAWSDRLAAALPELRCVDESESRSILVGELRDQAELYTILARPSELGLDIDSIVRVDEH